MLVTMVTLETFENVLRSQLPKTAVILVTVVTLVTFENVLQSQLLKTAVILVTVVTLVILEIWDICPDKESADQGGL